LLGCNAKSAKESTISLKNPKAKKLKKSLTLKSSANGAELI